MYYHATYHSFIQGPYTHNISHVFKVKQTQNFISIDIICTGSFAEKKELESTDVVHQTNDLLLLHKDVALAMHGAPVMNETTRTEQGLNDAAAGEEWGNNEGKNAPVTAPFSPAVGHAVSGEGSASFTTCW